MPSTTDIVENSSGDNCFDDRDVLPNNLLHAVQHKINYQTLKDAYQKLQASYIKLESELALKLKDMQIMEQKYNQMEKKAKNKIRLLEEAYEETARTQLTQERLEIIKLQVREDIEEHYREQIAQAHAGIVAAQDETGRLREEAVKLATELDRERSESQTKIAQNKMLYEAEIKEELTSRINRLTTDEIDRSHIVGKENAQLTTKCDLLSGELEEMKSKMDSHREKLVQENKSLRKNNSELKVLNQELEAERDSLRKQLQLLKTEFETIRIELVTERQRAFDAVRVSSEAENRLSCLTQKTRLELSNLRLEAQQQRSEIEVQRDQFAGKCQVLEQELQLMMSKCQQVESAAAMRELEISQREVTVRDQLNEEISRLESKVFQLTEKLSKTQRALEEVKSHKQSTCDTVEPQPTSAEDNHLRNELDMLNCRLKEAQEFNKKLSEKLYHALEKSTDGPKNNEMGNRNEFAELDRELRIQLHHLREEKRELEDKLHSARANLTRYMENAGKNKNNLVSRIKELKRDVRLKELEMEKMRAENDLLRRNVPHAEYQRIRAVLDDLRRRHEEYEEIILGPLHPLCILPDTAIQTNDLPPIPESPCRPSVLRHDKPCCTQVPIERIPVSRETTTQAQLPRPTEHITRETHTIITKTTPNKSSCTSENHRGWNDLVLATG
ncbi:hypothetical protein EG68_08346 [Paragonimus skrjabini miyazakii]|uniref:Uncharacterized protein n=1 Tax=Paragonimus skrjabini miyazakii TaxID=59628 RepID=A0A8S9YDY7_9TREM|nr:hypothetical protein EG68_08346 [Paragonimus skrjabini miyazakii]